jgi:hypothetical protein
VVKAPQPPVRRLQWVDSKGYLTEYGQATLREQVEYAGQAYVEQLQGQITALQQDIARLAHEITFAFDPMQRVDTGDLQNRVAGLEQRSLTLSTELSAAKADFASRLSDMNSVVMAVRDRADVAYTRADPSNVASAFADMNIVFNAVAVRRYLVTGGDCTVNLTASDIEAQAYTAKTSVVAPNTDYFTEADIS